MPSAATARPQVIAAPPIIFRPSIWSVSARWRSDFLDHARRLGRSPSTTFQEAIRRRWVTALLGFAVVMLGVSTFFTWMSARLEQQKFLRDYGLGFTIIMTLIAADFSGRRAYSTRNRASHDFHDPVQTGHATRISDWQISRFDADACAQSGGYGRDFAFYRLFAVY